MLLINIQPASAFHDDSDVKVSSRIADFPRYFTSDWSLTGCRREKTGLYRRPLAQEAIEPVLKAVY